MTTRDRVRQAMPKDRAVFMEMWDAFVATDPNEPGDREMGPINWARIHDPDCALGCLVAVDVKDRPQGFLLHLAFPFSWSKGDICYLQDLYVKEEARGRGYAQALIHCLAATGRKAGWFKIFWMTQADNHAAKRLYDKLAIRSDFLRYDLTLTAGLPPTGVKR